MSTVYYKYPRTPHLPFSQGMSDDDKRLSSTTHFQGMQIVVTEKMDGENTTIYNNKVYARSIDSAHRSYHSYLFGRLLPAFQYMIPENWRVCGEYLYAKHSIYYDSLIDYFLCFSVWNEFNYCLNWEDTKWFCIDRNIKMVPELYIGTYDDNIILNIAQEVCRNGGEGIVVRNVESFSYEDFSKNIAKYVRKDHVQTDQHWSQQQVIPNLLAN